MDEAAENSESREISSRGIRATAEVAKFLLTNYRGLERHLVGCKNEPVPHEVIESYEINRAVIEKIYGKVSPNEMLLHHGTGALQYSGEKYQSGVKKDEYQQVLEGILTMA